MISFKLEPDNHAALSRWSKRFFQVVFVLAAGVLMFMGIDGYREASSILADHSVVNVPVELEGIDEERGRRGRTRHMFDFGYAFEVDGTQYRGAFTTSESNAEKYLGDGTTIDIAYSNADPARFDRLDKLQGMAGAGSLVKRMAIAVLGAAFLAFVMHMLLVAKLFVPRKPEPEPEAAAG
ncbi:DUF3592 domain-containing protein [Luteimonas sp. SJ-92]|uniref:DUF3592 domain-containing protein n=1 Tax=Luteimonas salinisoli TaxID=2752307 RepID=A0A853JAK7_9GAMM|nr:DUF3592 domain-containing protein [Luteimonas salinisoli]NZA25699.1 DUF3592 domain-containing protein [Luteimonas salinisoli]